MKGGAAGLSGLAALVVLLPMEAGFEVIAVVGTTALFLAGRRRKGGTPGAWREASCPACLGVSLLAERVPALAELTEAESVPS